MTFGQKLKFLRKQKNWTQHDLSEQISIGQSTIHDYEGDNKMPRPETLIKMARLFEVTTDYLLGVVDNPQGEDKVLSKTERLDKIAQSNPILNNDKLDIIKNLSDEEAEIILQKLQERLSSKSSD